MAVYSYDTIIKYKITAECREPLHIGSGSADPEEILMDPVEGTPFVQASGIAGVFRNYCENTYGQEVSDELFGKRRKENGEEESGSRLKISDGIFEKAAEVRMELRPRVSIDPVTGTCDSSEVKGTERKSGHKFNMGYISAGTEFTFSVYLYDKEKKDVMEDLFSAMNQGVILFGGQKSNGCGVVKVKKLLYKEFHMCEKEARNLWYREEELQEKDYEDITAVLSTESKTKNAYEITVTGCTEGELLVKSIAVSGCGEGFPDSENIRNGKGDYIVPGSSLKGAVRAQMEQIEKRLQKSGRGTVSLIENSFGSKGNPEEKGKTGNLLFYDTVVGEQEENDKMPLSHRIHIDKFTGGVMQGGLFSEKNVAGNLTMRIAVRDKNDPEKTCGLLLLALRDLAIGVMNIGSGYNVGKGIIQVDKIFVKRKDHSEAIIDFGSGKTDDKNKIIAGCLAAIREGAE